MMDFSLRNHDLDISNGDLLLCPTDSDAIAQAIGIRLKTFSGEWFLDENRGLPYLSHIFGKKLNERYVRTLMTQEIKGVSGVLDVQSFQLAPHQSERSLTISLNVILTDQKNLAINQIVGA